MSVVTKALLAGFLFIGCGSGQQAVIPPGTVLLTQAEHARLSRAAAEVMELRQAMAALLQRVRHVEQRVGLKPLDGTGLKRARPGQSVRLPRRAKFVGGHGERAEKRSLADHLGGRRAYVISYWATWCKPCTSPEELRHLRHLQAQLSRQGVDLVSIAVDGLSKVQRDPRAPGWLYPLWQSNDAHLEMLPRAFMSEVGVGLPLFLVVGPTGNIQYYLKTKLDDAAVRDLVSATAAACRS